MEDISTNVPTLDDIDTITSDYVNDLTLNLLMNKSKHQKYISKSNPTEYKREQQHRKMLQSYKFKILDFTRKLIEEDAIISTDVNDGFANYTKMLLRYLKMKEFEKNEELGFVEEDVLFGTMDESSDDNEPQQSTEPICQQSDMFSFWGSKIEKRSETILD
tara:strand:- start:536 stop:1018 length:483 start_codon:yes stop_codon:yes gene_type:complete